MAKRFTATEKWDKAWYRKLSPRHKALWQFLVDRCDQVGMWEVDVDSASHFINDVTPITEEDFKIFGPRLEKFGNDKLWIVDFVSFQCGDLSEKSPAHKPIFKLLKKYNLLNRVLVTLSNRVLEIEKEIEKEEEGEKEVEKEKERPKELVFGEKKSLSIAVKPVYAKDQPIRIYDLEKYFAHTGQLKEFISAGFTGFDDFLQANPANVFKDPEHLYNTFRKFHVDRQLRAVGKKEVSLESLKNGNV